MEGVSCILAHLRHTLESLFAHTIAYSHALMHARTHTHARTDAHTYMHAQTHTHTICHHSSTTQLVLSQFAHAYLSRQAHSQLLAKSCGAN